MRLMVMRQDTRTAQGTANDLQSVGFGADFYSQISDASEALANNKYDLVVMEPRACDGDAIAWLRGGGGRRPPGDTFVLVLSDREEERIAALEAGADDSARSLVSSRELVAKVRAILRRPREQVASILAFQELSLCTVSREIRVFGHTVTMQRREISIVEALLRRAGRVVSRPLLEQDIYGMQSEYCPNSLEVRISRIRRHLSDAGSSVTIETVRGIGYRLTTLARAAGRPGRMSSVPMPDLRSDECRQLSAA